jgi:hypothetical protein
MASPAAAAEPVQPIELCAPDVRVRRVQMTHQGEPGIWFDARVAKCMLVQLQTIDALRAQAMDYEVRAGMHGQLTLLLERQVDLAALESEKAVGALQRAVKGQREAEEALNKPGRSRALWFALGVFSGVLVIGVSAYAINATR